MQQLSFDSSNEACSSQLGRQIGALLEPGDVLALWGELGAGKTFIARSIARGLGVPDSIPVTSPTFTFINEYEARLHLFHLDLYRLGDPDELETLPWREALFGSGVALIEWPERLGHLLPDERWDIRLHITGENSRTITIAPHGENQRLRMSKWKQALEGLAPATIA